MIGYHNKFITLNDEKRGNITFGNNSSSRIVGKGTVSLDNINTKTQNVVYVEGIKHNIIIVSQMCDQGYNLTFHSKGCEIRKQGLGRLVENVNRTLSNVHILNEVKGENFCMVQVNQTWLFHRRMGHINFENIVKLSKT
jgi:hypothetical protein